MFNKVCEFLNENATYPVKKLITSAEIRKATGANSERLCYIMEGLMRSGNVARVKRGIYRIEAHIPDFVTSDIIEKANRGYGRWDNITRKYLRESPTWKVGEPNPWFEWYGIPQKPNTPKKSENPVLTTTADGIIIASDNVEFSAKGQDFKVTKEKDYVTIGLENGNKFHFTNRDFELVRKFVLNSQYGAYATPTKSQQDSSTFIARPGETIFYIDDNRVCSAKLLGINLTWDHKLGKNTTYTTIHGTYSSDRVFPSKDALIKSL